MITKNILTNSIIATSILFGGMGTAIASNSNATPSSTWVQSKICHGLTKNSNINYQIKNAQLTTGKTQTTLLVNFNQNISQYSLTHPTGFPSAQSGQIVITIKNSMGGDSSYLAYNIFSKTLTTWSVEIGTDNSVKTLKNANVTFNGKQMYVNMPKNFFKTTKNMPLNLNLEYVKSNPNAINVMTDDYLFADSSCTS